MANDRSRMTEGEDMGNVPGQRGGLGDERTTGMGEDRPASGPRREGDREVGREDDVRGIADEGDEFDESDDMDEEEEEEEVEE